MPYKKLDDRLIGRVKRVVGRDLILDLKHINNELTRMDKLSSQNIYNEFRLDKSIHTLIPKLFWAIRNKSVLQTDIEKRLLGLLRKEQIRDRYEIKILKNKLSRSAELKRKIEKLGTSLK